MEQEEKKSELLPAILWLTQTQCVELLAHNQSVSRLAISSKKKKSEIAGYDVMCRGLLNRTVPNQQVWRLLPKHKYFRPPSDCSTSIIFSASKYIITYTELVLCSGMSAGINSGVLMQWPRTFHICLLRYLSSSDSHA